MPRLIFSSARERQFPEVFCGVHVKWATPIAAIILQVYIVYIALHSLTSIACGITEIPQESQHCFESTMACRSNVSYLYSLQTFSAALYISSGDISSLIESFNAALWVFLFLSFISVLIMRFTHKDDKRPFKVNILSF